MEEVCCSLTCVIYIAARFGSISETRLFGPFLADPTDVLRSGPQPARREDLPQPSATISTGLQSAAAGYLEGEVPRFFNSEAFSSGKLRALLRLGGRDRGEAGRSPARSAQTLAQGLHAARRTSQERAKRISALKSEVNELKAAREKDKRLVHYLLSDAFDRRGPWVTGVG